MKKKSRRNSIGSEQLTLGLEYLLDLGIDSKDFHAQVMQSNSGEGQMESKVATNLTLDNAHKVHIPVETTFEVSQGLREVATHWDERKVQMKVVFDCRHLELAQDYISGGREVFEPQEEYLIGKGGLVNTSVFFNLLRCCQTLDAWSRKIQQCIGKQPIISIEFEPPSSGKPIGQLWKNLGMPNLYVAGNTPQVSEFQSRYITPILWVDKTNESEVLSKFTGWIADISDRLGEPMKVDLLMIASEVTSNLVKYGFSQGFYGVSIWRSGQVEIVWSNSIEHLKNWPPDDTAKGLADSLQSRTAGGAGMAYILNHLLPQYSGVLAVNCKGNDLIFRSSGRCELYSQSSSDRGAFLPTSILFTLHLFCSETRDRS